MEGEDEEIRVGLMEKGDVGGEKGKEGREQPAEEQEEREKMGEKCDFTSS